MQYLEEGRYLEKNFETRDDLIAYVKTLAPWLEHEKIGERSYIQGGRLKAEMKLNAIDPVAYAYTRNFGNGNITRLSPYIHHGVMSLNEVRNFAVEHCKNTNDIYKFIQELGWRDYWQKMLSLNPDWAWIDVEPYKTGFLVGDYAQTLPYDIAQGATGVACIDAFIHELIATGYLHNHARMYLASYIVHFRRVKWQAGAQWFLQHLLDGDTASNNLSWQWVASTFSHKPYIFNLENVDKYFGKIVDTRPQHNEILDAEYSVLSAKLFPNLECIS